MMRRNVLSHLAFLLWWSASSATGFGTTAPFVPSTVVSSRKALTLATKGIAVRRGGADGTRRRLALFSNPADTAIVPSKASVETTTPRQNIFTRNEHIARLGRCTFVFLGCLLTFGLRQSPQVSAIAASAITGIVACGIGYAPVAAFCGSFAGMSAHVSTVASATTMALATSLVFGIFDARKLLVGVGGRLGLIALLSNLLVITTLHQGSLQTAVAEMVRTLGGWKITGSLAVLTVLAKVAPRLFKNQDNNTMMTTFKATVKATIAGLLLFTSSTDRVAALVSSLVAIYTSTMIVQESGGVVLPVALLGLAGALILPQYAAAIYLGGFIGMTGKPRFRSGQAAQASVVAAVALVSGLWNGLGGRLGSQAAVGVLFSLL